MPTSTIRFESRDGTSLVGDWYLADNPRGAALIVHGYAEHAGRYEEVALALTEVGVHAFAFDLRGHGRSAGRRGHCRHFSEFLEDFDAAHECVSAYAGSGLPIVAIGHSNGGLITLAALCREGAPQPTAAVLSSPFLALKLAVPAVTRLAGTVASRLWPSLAFPNALVVEDLTRDPQKQAERQQDSLCHGVATARWFTEAQRTQAEVATKAGTISVPTCWLVAGDDPIADSRVARRVYEALRAPGEFHELEGFRHEVFNEVQRAHALAIMVDFVKRQLR